MRAFVGALGICLVLIGLLVLITGCGTAPERAPFWYRIYEVDPQTNEAIGKEYTCHSDREGKTKCWEDGR